MLYYQHAWPESFSTCPCDRDFVEWLQERSINFRTIYHFGTGLHHYVGLHADTNNVIGITASRGEQDAYEQLVIANPYLALNYQCIFNDIYCYNPRLLPSFDIATMFHLGEFPEYRDYALYHHDDHLLRSFMSRSLVSGGLVVFYQGSMAWPPTTKPLVDKLVAENRLTLVEAYASLLFYRIRE